MFKSTSENSQRRDRNAVVNDRKNYTHEDFTKRANDISHEKVALVSEKRELEAFFAKIRMEAERASRYRASSRSRTTQNVLVKFETQKVQSLHRLAQIDKRLGELKRENHELHSGAHAQMSYTDAFFRSAKATLPHEIMQRIESAALALLAHHNDVAEPKPPR